MITYRLRGGGQAGGTAADGLSAAGPPRGHGPQHPDVCYHDPFSPVPGDTTALSLRDDVLTYTGPELTGPVTVSGPAELRLRLSSTAPWMHLAAVVWDVPGGGSAAVLGQAVAHLSGLGRQPGPMTVVSMPMPAAVLRAGHRLRLQLYRGWCAQCPAPDLPAVDRIYHDGPSPCSLTVPAGPAAGLPAGPHGQITASSSS
jgi:uncharacterized protein